MVLLPLFLVAVARALASGRGSSISALLERRVCRSLHVASTHSVLFPERDVNALFFFPSFRFAIAVVSPSLWYSQSTSCNRILDPNFVEFLQSNYASEFNALLEMQV
jgi:hypothetical protein